MNTHASTHASTHARVEHSRLRRAVTLVAVVLLLAALQTLLEQRLAAWHAHRLPTASDSGTSLPPRSAQLRVAGYGGPMLLQLELDGRGCIARIRVRAHNETAGIGAPLLEGPDAWLQRWRGSCPFTAGGHASASIDGTSGATLTAVALERALSAGFAPP